MIDRRRTLQLAIAAALLDLIGGWRESGGSEDGLQGVGRAPGRLKRIQAVN